MNEDKKQPSKLTMSSYSPARALGTHCQNSGLNMYESPYTNFKTKKEEKKPMEIHPEGKIVDVKYRGYSTEKVLKAVEKSKLLPENEELIKQFIRDARLGKTIKKGAKKKVGLLRQAKYSQDLKKLDKYFKKPLTEVTETDMENFILDLEEGAVSKKNGEPYAPETQIAIKKIVIKFYKWLNNGEIPEIVDWIDTSCEIKDYDAPSKEEIEKLLIIMTSREPESLIRNRALLMVLFDSGARADELLNMRLKHLEEENGDYKVRIEFSKTQKRTLSLPFATKYLKEWLDIHPARTEPLAQLFPMSYSNLCHLVKRLGRFIGRKMTPHTLRHSSATYWAGKLTQYQLCYRMGWSMNSKQPARYIDRAGIDQERISQVVKAEGMSRVQEQNEELHRRLALMEEQLQRFMETDKAEVRKILALVRDQDSS